MSKVIYSGKTIYLNHCDIWATGCTINMKDCKVIARVCDLDECTRIKVENESLKSQAKVFADAFQAKDDRIRDLADNCHDLYKMNTELRKENDKLRKKIDKLFDERNQLLRQLLALPEKSSDPTTDQLSKTLGSVDSEENAKLHVKPNENGEGTF